MTIVAKLLYCCLSREYYCEGIFFPVYLLAIRGYLSVLCLFLFAQFEQIVSSWAEFAEAVSSGQTGSSLNSTPLENNFPYNRMIYFT